MHLLLVSTGTGGDTLPFIAWGQVLQERGHDVTVMGNGAYRRVAEARQVSFVDIISAEEHERRCRVRDQSAKEWQKSALNNILAEVLPVYQEIQRRARPGETVVVANVFNFGARLAEEKLGLATATVLIYPRLLFSFDDPLVRASALPRFLRRGIGWMVRQFGDRALRGPMNAYRAEVGLPPLSEAVLRWWFSPTRVIGLFPEWYASPQPDWPPNTAAVGFGLSHSQHEPPLSAAVEEFLQDGPAPLVFSYSTALSATQTFFQTAIEVTKRLERRAILLAPPPQLVDALPAQILAAPAQSHLRLFPRASLAVHHAGMGSTAAALAAGIPQFHVPFAMDQPDNAERCRRLGLSRYCSAAGFQPNRVLADFRHLLEDPAVIERCRQFASREESFAGFQRGAELLEALNVRREPTSHSLADDQAISPAHRP